ncbi:MAG: nitroreductase/quinone reductase family protein [Pseudolysinimonas sp.]
MSSWNDNAIAEFRDNNGVTERWGRSLIVMHTIGAKSGAERVTPVMGHRNDRGWFVVASKGGAPDNPAWYHNLLAHPSFDIEANVDGEVQTVPVTARELEADEYAEAWQRITARVPAFAQYETRTSRKIPVFLLERS